MQRYKWFLTNLKMPIGSISEEMLSCQFSQNVDEGFLISKVRKNFIEGKYIEKKIITEKIENPFGYIEENQLVKYIVTNFSLSDDTPIGLMILNPPRSMSSFFTAIHRMTGLGSSISELKVDPLVWAQKFENILGRIIVFNISVSGINISNSSLAKVSILGESDVRNDSINFIGNHSYSNRLVKFSYFNNQVSNQKYIIEMRYSTLVTVHGHSYENVLPAIKDGLLQSQKSI